MKHAYSLFLFCLASLITTSLFALDGKTALGKRDKGDIQESDNIDESQAKRAKIDNLNAELKKEFDLIKELGEEQRVAALFEKASKCIDENSFELAEGLLRRLRIESCLSSERSNMPERDFRIAVAYESIWRATKLSSYFHKARENYQDASKLGHIEAHFRLGRIYLYIRECSDEYFCQRSGEWALEEFGAAALAGHLQASAMFYASQLEGFSVYASQRKLSEVDIANRAEEGNCLAEQYLVGSLHLEFAKKQTEPEAKEARKTFGRRMLLKAADQGDVLASYLLGCSYLEDDSFQAEDWLERAAAKEHVGASFQLVKMSVSSDSPSDDKVRKALKRFKNITREQARYFDKNGHYSQVGNAVAKELSKRANDHENPGAWQQLLEEFLADYPQFTPKSENNGEPYRAFSE
jgi:TPR repeat protein